MVTSPRPRVALLLALCALVLLPSVASAQGAGDAEYGALPCTSTALDADNGACDARRPVPEIRTTPASPRAGGSVAIVARSPGRGLSYAWDLDGDGAFDDGDGATLTRSFPAGTRTLRVRATDEDGRVGEATLTLQLHAGNLAPTGSVGPSLSSPRTGQALTVFAVGADRDGTVTRIELDADGDGTYELDQPIAAGADARVERSVTFATAGERTVRARFTDDGGSESVSSASVDVHAQNSKPSITYLGASARAGQPGTVIVQGEDVDGTIVKRELDLDGDGTFETPADAGGQATHTFAVAGPALIGARVTDNEGATATRRQTIDVSAGNAPPTVRLYPQGDARTLMAVATDDGPSFNLTYAWDLDGDGAFDDLVGQSNTASVPANVTGNVEVAVRVTDAEGASAVGRYQLSLSDEPPGPPSFNGNPQQPRVGQAVTFTLGYSPDAAKIEWDDNGDGVYERWPGDQLSKTYTTPGTYVVRVRLTDKQGRVVTSRHAVTVAPAAGNLPPSISIVGYSTVRTGAPVTLQVNYSDTDSTGTLTYAWDLDEDGQFDDGSSSDAAASFATAGEHDVAVRVTDADGGVSTQYKTLAVHTANRAPQIQISAAGPGGTLVVRPDTPISLFYSALSTDDPIVAWAWDTDADGQFDDGTTAPKTVSFSEVGLHRVYVRGTDSGGLSGVGVLLVEVTPVQANRAPTVRLVLPGGVVAPGALVDLAASAGDPDGDALTYAWDADGDGAFDDGAARTISFVYPQAGSYDVAVKVTDALGASRTMLQTLLVDPTAGIPPVFGVTFYRPVRVGVPTQFSLFVAGEDQFTYTFDMDGDGQFDDAPATLFSNFVWTFATGDPVLVSVRATDPGGRVSTRSVQITPGAENLAPTVLVGVGEAVPGSPVELRALYTDEDSGGLGTYAWDLDADGQFDDGASSIASPTFGPGTHTVSVRVTDDEGASTIASRTIVVGSRPPLADFALSVAEPGIGQTVTLTSTSTDPDGGAIASYAWDLDDDGAFDDASGPVATAVFYASGARRIGLKVRDGGGDTGIRYTRFTVATFHVDPPMVFPTPVVTPEAPSAAATPQPKDTTKPVVRISLKQTKLATLAKSGLSFTVTCDERCSLAAVLSVDKPTAKRLKLGAKLELGRATGKGGTVKIKLGAKARKAIAKQRSVKLKLTITAVDGAGNRRVTTKTLTVKR